MTEVPLATLACRDPKARVAQRVHEFASGHVPRACRDEALDGLLGHVVVVAIESTPRDVLRRGEGVQLGQIVVADEVRPESSVGWPPRRVDQDGHSPIISPTRGADAFAASGSVG